MKSQELLFVSEYYLTDFMEKMQHEVKRMNKKGYLLVKFDCHNLEGNDGNCYGILLFEKWNE